MLWLFNDPSSEVSFLPMAYLHPPFLPLFIKQALSSVLPALLVVLAYFLPSAFSLPVSSVYVSLAKSHRRHGCACYFSASVTQLHSWPAVLLRGRETHGANIYITTVAWAPNTKQGMERPGRVLMALLRGAWLFYPKFLTLQQTSLATSLRRRGTRDSDTIYASQTFPPGLRIAFENMYLSILPIFTLPSLFLFFPPSFLSPIIFRVIF